MLRYSLCRIPKHIIQTPKTYVRKICTQQQSYINTLKNRVNDDIKFEKLFLNTCALNGMVFGGMCVTSHFNIKIGETFFDYPISSIFYAGLYSLAFTWAGSIVYLLIPPILVVRAGSLCLINFATCRYIWKYYNKQQTKIDNI